MPPLQGFPIFYQGKIPNRYRRTANFMLSLFAESIPESKSETEKLRRQAMEDYENKKFIAKADNITLGELLDIWAEELKTGTLSNGTVGTYPQSTSRIKQHPVSRRKLKTVTSGHLQQFMDIMSFGGAIEDFVSKGYSKDYVTSFSALLQQSFRFGMFPKQYITFNPMQLWL